MTKERIVSISSKAASYAVLAVSIGILLLVSGIKLDYRTAMAECYPSAKGFNTAQTPDCLHVNGYLTSDNKAYPVGVSSPQPVVTTAYATYASSTVALAAGESWTSPAFDTTDGRAYISYAAKSVTPLTVYFQESGDGSTWTSTDEYDVAKGSSNYSSHKISARYGRVVVQNGTIANAGGSSNLAIYVAQSLVANETDVSITDNFGNPLTAAAYTGLRVTTPSDYSVFGEGVISDRISQFTADFSQPLTSSDIVSGVTASGSVSAADGLATISTGTSSTASAVLASNGVVNYSPGREVYFMGSTKFTTPTNANSYQRIGLYNNKDGWFIGYEGLQFGVTHRVNGVDTFTPQTSFTEDSLVGETYSRFTRNGVAEAFNPTKLNVFRIRYGYLGAAEEIFEIKAPDGPWVPFNIIKWVNNNTTTNVTNPNLPFRSEVSKSSSDATNIQLGMGSLAAGVTQSPESDNTFTDSISSNGQYSITNTAGKSTLMYSLQGTWVGTLAIEGQTGDNNWQSIGAYDENTYQLIFSTTTNRFLSINCAGFNQVRIRATSWSSGTVNVSWNAAAGQRTVTAKAQATEYTHIRTAATTVVKSGPGRLQRIVINTAINNATLTMYDNTAASGVVIANIVTPNQGNPVVLDYGNLAFFNGLTIVTTLTGDYTVVWQ